jgi:hypothetical protein
MSDLNAPLTPEQIAAAELKASHEGYLHKVLVGLDQFLNTAAGGNPDETISSRSQRLSDQGNEFAKLLTYGLDLIQKDHGRKAEAGDLERTEKVEAIEKETLGDA